MKKVLNIITLPFLLLFTTKKVLAVCPVCTIAVGAGLGISRQMGIDDTVVGVWVGGLILSGGLWLADFLKKKNVKTPHLELISIIFLAVLTIVPLYFIEIIGIPLNKLYGIDKILLGTIIGSLAFILSVWMDKYLRTKNNGRVFIYYQKVVLPLLLLTLTSFLFYLIT